MDWSELIGWAAALFAFGAYAMKTMVPLRVLAVCSNGTAIVYALAESLYPMLALNVLLLPLNGIRLVQMLQLVRQVRTAVESDLSLDWLRPYMKRRRLGRGEVLFRKGDSAHELFYVLEGRLRLEEIDGEIGPGQLIGEIGVFNPDKARTLTVTGTTDCVLLAITDDELMQLYYQNPRFGFYLIQLITRRLTQDIRRLEARLQSDGAPSAAASG